MIKEMVLFVCILGYCSAGITYNNVVKPEVKPNAIESSDTDDLEGAETLFLGGFGGGNYGGYGGGGACCGGGVPNGYEAYFGGGGYGGNYGGGYGGDYGGYGGGYGDYGGCCG